MPDSLIEILRSPRWLGRASAVTARFAEFSSIVSLLLMTLLVSTQVVLRYVFGKPLPWAEEAAVYMMVWMAFVGSAVALRHSEHIALGLLVNRLTGWQAVIARVLVNAAMLVFLALVIVLGIQLAMTISGQRSPALGINMFWPYLILPMGCLLMGIEVIDRLFLLLLPNQTRSLA